MCLFVSSVKCQKSTKIQSNDKEKQQMFSIFTLINESTHLCSSIIPIFPFAMINPDLSVYYVKKTN